MISTSIVANSQLTPMKTKGSAVARAAACGLWFIVAFPTQAKVGADIPWTTVEAETMPTNGVVLGPAYAPHRVETESSGQRCVRLARAGDFVEFSAPAAFNSLVLRYSLPDAPRGGGTSSELVLSINGKRIESLALSSRNAWLYGAYPFSNDPAGGKPRNSYDEVRRKNLTIAPGDTIRLQKTNDDGVACILDLVDLESAAPPLGAPEGSLSVRDFGAAGEGRTDDTVALRRCIAAAQKHGGVVWVPAGDYKLTGDIVVPSGVTIQGAGLWHTTFVGDAARYAQADRRVRFKLSGAGIHLADFAIVGALNYRIDQEPNDGVVVAGCRDSSVSRLWIEHTKAGVWVYNGTRLTIDGCRFRNLLADGVNFCVGTNHSVVQNCTARGTGDDCYAMWPAASDQGYDDAADKPGDNVIRRSTGQLAFLANGASLYGGANNRIEDCAFTDITAGCGILISTTFPTSDPARGVDNNFSGTTVVENCAVARCGGYDHVWGWRGALQVCMDRRSIAGLRVRGVTIRDSLSDAISITAPGQSKGEGRLSDAVLANVTVCGFGEGKSPARGLRVRADVSGSLSLVRSHIPEMRNDSASFEIAVQPE